MLIHTVDEDDRQDRILILYASETGLVGLI